MSYRNRAIYRHYEPPPQAVTNPAIVRECVPLWREAAKRAHSRYGDGRGRGNNLGCDTRLYSADDKLREHGITFDGDRRTYLSYEKAIRAACQQ